MTVSYEMLSVERLKAENRPLVAADWETAHSFDYHQHVSAPSYFYAHCLIQSPERMLTCK